MISLSRWALRSFKSATWTRLALVRAAVATFGSSRPMCRLRQRVNQLLIHAVGGAQMKFALLSSNT